ncbi:hypothetical protein THIX_90195 [Thiomonas sp. X19]|uniref:hypothetical protein n=1 Tax=Thiomonas sp. X19 TaxID=1050370 RepID=UPI000B64F958|nr:hypothetical protein [Thiomonas sp. X19]SCC95426.1 hypothetical protein THIX_90195 [Thiomonas sp. X19]
MRAADLVKSIWGERPPANAANLANAVRVPPGHSQDSQVSQGVEQGNRRLPGVLHIAADPFDPADFGLECITHLHQHGIVAALVGDAIHLHGLAEASPAVADEADALLHLHGNDLRAALRAQQRARQAIDQAAGKDCEDRQP